MKKRLVYLFTLVGALFVLLAPSVGSANDGLLHVDVTFRVIDQSGGDIPGSLISVAGVGQVATGDSIALPAGTHTVTVPVLSHYLVAPAQTPPASPEERHSR